RINKCDSITMDELYTFQALLILMGIVKKPEIKMYWCKDPMLETPFFSKCMTLVRFQNILAMMHFSPETDSQDKLYKIRPVVEYLKDRFQSIYRPAENISIDESLMKWQGRLSFKQFNRNKRARFGIKLYETCDSKNGYVYNFKIYVGKDENDSNKKSLLGISGNVVMDLLSDLGEQGRSLYIDNWYSSPWLFLTLHNAKTNVCGTVRPNRAKLPKVNKKEIKNGEMKVFSSPRMTYMLWKDKRLVTMLSTKHAPEMVVTNKVDYHTKQKKQKPNIVLEYNDNMGGVDLSDQCITPYEILRKSQKWYIKTFFHLLDLAIFNAWVVYNTVHADKKLKFLHFRNQLARELLEHH
ncbi:PREDICTED: piggyBac transposable element-derived protein 4-like, partial [Trachymyrmex cornetzi]